MDFLIEHIVLSKIKGKFQNKKCNIFNENPTLNRSLFLHDLTEEHHNCTI